MAAHWWATLLLVTGACAGTNSPPSIANTSEEPELGTWVVSASPSWQLGGDLLGAEYELHNARGVRRLSSGEVVLANAGTSELRAFTPDGELLWKAGRPGDGPGDFRNPAWVEVLPGDTLMVLDTQLNRLSYWTPEGQLARTELLTDALRCGPKYPGLRDGVLVAADCDPWQDVSPGLHRRTRFLTLVGPRVRNGRRRLAVVEGSEMLVAAGQRYWYPPFGVGTVLAARDSLIFYGTGSQFQVDVYSESGTHLRTIGLPRGRRPVSEALKAEWLERADQRLRDLIARRGGTPREEPGERPETIFMDSVPAYGHFLIDPDLNLWVGEYTMIGQIPMSWTVLSQEGRWLAEVVTPPRFRIWEVGRNYLLGVWKDDDDVERVRMHLLTRSGAAQ